MSINLIASIMTYLSTADQKEHLQAYLARLDSHASTSNTAYTSIYCTTFTCWCAQLPIGLQLLPSWEEKQPRHHQNSHQKHHVMAIHGYLRSAWLSHRARHVFIFKGILRPQTRKQNSIKLSIFGPLEQCARDNLVTLGGAMVISVNKQN